MIIHFILAIATVWLRLDSMIVYLLYFMWNSYPIKCIIIIIALAFSLVSSRF